MDILNVYRLPSFCRGRITIKVVRFFFFFSPVFTMEGAMKNKTPTSCYKRLHVQSIYTQQLLCYRADVYGYKHVLVLEVTSSNMESLEGSGRTG